MVRRKREGENGLVFEPDDREYSELKEGLEEFGIWWGKHYLAEWDRRAYEDGLVVVMEDGGGDRVGVYFLCKRET